MAGTNFPSIAQILGNRIELAIQNMSQNLKDADAIASNVLNQSLDFTTQIFGTKVEIHIMMEDYWRGVDEGQKPGHRPQIDKILKWMAHKGIQPKPSIRQRKVFKGNRKFKASIMALNREQLAKRIVEKIYRVGTKPTYYASDVINEEWQTRVASQLQAVGATDIRFTLNVPKETII